MNHKPDMNEVVNSRGETRAAHIKRIDETAKKLAAILAQSAASYTEVDLLFERAKEHLYVTNRP